jgi:hypothetical protein
MAHKSRNILETCPEENNGGKEQNINKATKVCGHLRVHSSVTPLSTVPVSIVFPQVLLIFSGPSTMPI